MKQRQKQQKPASSGKFVDVGSGSRIEFVDVAQPGMRILKGIDEGVGKSVTGCYVKYAPIVKSSERASLDTKHVRERLLAAGATAVVVVPVVVPDSTVDMKRLEPRRVSAEVHLREWFAGVKAVSPKLLESAVAEAVTTIGEAGL